MPITPLRADQPRAEQPEVSTPLPTNCSEFALPGEDPPESCVYGYVYLNGVPVAGATVTLRSSNGSLTLTTQAGPASTDPYYSATLSSAPLWAYTPEIIPATVSFAVEVNLSYFKVVSGSQQVDLFFSTTCGPTGVGGLITTNTTWTPPCGPYVVTANILVQDGVQLNIEPGVTVLLDSDESIQVDGVLSAVGLAKAMIAFTSNYTLPAAGDWGYLLLTDPAAHVPADNLQHVLIEYAGGLSVTDNGALRVNNSAPILQHLTVRHNLNDGVHCYNLANCGLDHASVNDNTGFGVYLFSTALSSSISSSTIYNNIKGGINIYNSAGTFTIADSFSGYNDGAGVLVTDASTGLNFSLLRSTIRGNHRTSDGAGVNLGSLLTCLAQDNLIQDNESTVNGGGIKFLYCTVEHNIISGNYAVGNGGGLYVGSSTSDTLVRNNIIVNNRADKAGGGIWFGAYNNLERFLLNNTVLWNESGLDGSGMNILNTITVQNNTILYNTSDESTGGGVFVTNFPLFNLNNLYSNAPYEFSNANVQGTADVNAEGNYWDTTVVSKIQAHIYDWYDNAALGLVDYDPFAASHILDAPISPPTILSTSAGTSSLSLSWTANPEADHAGYKVYYADEQGFPYHGDGADQGDSPIDVGDVTSFTLTGLPAGVYYVTVTAYDSSADGTRDQTGGNESWYAPEAGINVGVPLAADFSASPTSGAAPLTVAFTNQSTGVFTSCTWYFGDGNLSTSCGNPTHTYAVNGAYDVALLVSDGSGSSFKMRLDYIHVGTPPVANFTATPLTGIAPLTVNFTNTSTGDYATCSWTFGDGGTSTLCAPPSHIYTTAGVYTVALTVIGTGGTDTETKTGYITVSNPTAPVANFTATPTSGIAPLSVAFTNTSTGTYTTCSWNFGDGGTSTVCANPSHTYAAKGVYNVALTVTGPGGSDTETKNSYITVYAPAVANFTATPLTGIAPLTVSFTNTSTGDYTTCSWTFGDGGTSTLCAPPSHIYTSAGVYTVALTVTGTGGTDTETKTGYITVSNPAAPVANFTATPTSGIAPLSVAFTNTSTGTYTTCAWNFGDGGTSTVCANPSHTYAAKGVYNVALTVTGPGGSDTETKNNYITVYAPAVANFTATPLTGIAPLTVAFTNTSTGDYATCSWTFGDSGTSNLCAPPSHIYTTAGVYTVALTVTGTGGTDTETKTGYITVSNPPAPVANFTATPTSGIAPLSVAFTNTSTGTYTTCSWNFGDGGTSTVCANPSHTYAAKGVYNVALTVTGPGGSDTETKNSYITVYAPAVANFTATPLTGVAPLTVAFTNTSTGDYTTCSWTFGDGGTSTLCAPPSHIYTTAGVYTVALTVTGTGGTDTETKTGYITVSNPAAPVANFTGTPTSGIAPLSVAFTNTSTGTYTTCSWNFGDGGTSTVCANPSHTYAAKGVYNVALTVTGPGGSDTETKNNYITVYAPAVANFTATPLTGVAPLTVAFTNTSTGDYTTCSWTFGDGGTSALCAPPSHIYTSAGVYTVALTVTGTGGTDTETKTGYITVSNPAAPVANFTATPTSGIAPLSVAFTNTSTGTYTTCSWNFGDGGTSTVCANPSHTYAAKGVYNVALTVTGPGGSDTETKTGYISIYAPAVADFTATPLTGVVPLTVAFTNTSTGDYTTCSWTFGDGGTSALCAPPSHIYTTAGVYTVALTVTGTGGTDTETKTDYITVANPGAPVANFIGAPLSGVAPLTVIFTNTSIGDYTTCSWTFGDGGTSTLCANPSHTYAAKGVYNVSLTVTGPGGSDTETKTGYISIYAPAVADFTATPLTGVAPLTVAFTNTSTGDYTTCSWTFGDGGTSTLCAPPSHIYTTAGVYTVALTVTGTGGTDTETKTDYITVSNPGAPVANFTATPLSGEAPLTVNFTNTSTGEYTTCAWTFGDGVTSTLCANPSHIYTTAGVYTVVLTVTGPGGSDTKTRANYITVTDPGPVFPYKIFLPIIMR